MGGSLGYLHSFSLLVRNDCGVVLASRVWTVRTVVNDLCSLSLLLVGLVFEGENFDCFVDLGFVNN